MSNDLLNTLLNTTYTQNQLKHRLRILRLYLLKAFFGSQEGQNLDPRDLGWLSSLPFPFYKNFTKDNTYQILDDLENQAEKLPTLTIYLPIEATDNVCLQVGSYARKAFQHPTLLLETKFNPALIAGAALSWKGLYRDYSLKTKIESKSQEILQGFRKFLR